MPLKVGAIIKLIENDGWRVTIAGKPSRELSHVLEKSILKQAGLTRKVAR